MREQKLYALHLGAETLGELPLFITWSGPQQEALDQAATWTKWNIGERSRWNLLGFGAPKTDKWDLYIADLDQLARALGLKLQDLTEFRTRFSTETIVSRDAQRWLDRSKEQHLGHNRRQSLKSFESYTTLFVLAKRFELHRDIPLFSSQMDFLQSVIEK